MTLRDALRVIVLGDARDLPVLTTADLRTFFRPTNERSFYSGLRECQASGLLERVGRGVYVNCAWRAGPLTNSAAIVGMLATALRPGHLVYESCESALAHTSVLSQQPFWYTLQTTGSAGEYVTRYANLLFRHSSRPRGQILANVQVDASTLLPVAHPRMALEDMRRVYPNMPFELDLELQSEVEREWGAYHE